MIQKEHIFLLNTLASKHYDWVEAMGWHNKSVLEALALIASEVGEAMAENFGASITDKFGEELADIVLRSIDLAHWQKIDIDEQIRQDTKLVGFSFATTTPADALRTVTIQLSKTINAARKANLEPDFGLYLCRTLQAVMHAAYISNIDLKAEIVAKMTKNATNGTRGRRI